MMEAVRLLHYTTASALLFCIILSSTLLYTALHYTTLHYTPLHYSGGVWSVRCASAGEESDDIPGIRPCFS
jgi:hypothetical protein